MYVTRAVELFTRTRQVLEIPNHSELLGVRLLPSKGEGIFLDIVYDEPEDGRIIKEKRIIFIAQLGDSMEDFDVDRFFHIGSVQFVNGPIFNVWDCGRVEE